MFTLQNRQKKIAENDLLKSHIQFSPKLSPITKPKMKCTFFLPHDVFIEIPSLSKLFNSSIKCLKHKSLPKFFKSFALIKAAKNISEIFELFLLKGKL